MTQPRHTRRFKEALARVQHLFVETPSARLTTADAAEMAGLDEQVCRVLLRTLIEAGFLSSASGASFSIARRIPTRLSKKSGFHDHIDHIAPSLPTACRTAAASPRRIPGNAGAQINQAAGHSVIRGGTLGVRRHAQGARHGELLVPHRRWPVCAIDHISKNEPVVASIRQGPGAGYRLSWRAKRPR